MKSNQTMREPNNDILSIKMIWMQSSDTQFWFSEFWFCVIAHMLTQYTFLEKCFKNLWNFLEKIFEIFFFKKSFLDAKWRFLNFEKKKFYILWKKSRLKSTFLPYHVKKHHSTLEIGPIKVTLRSKKPISRYRNNY